MTFADKLRTYREQKGLSQAELGELTGITQATICNYEKGLKTPKSDKLAILSRFFNVSMDELYRNEVNSNTDP